MTKWVILKMQRRTQRTHEMSVTLMVCNRMQNNFLCLLLKDDKYFFLTWAESGFVNKQN